MLKIVLPVVWLTFSVLSIWAFWLPSDDLREAKFRAGARFWCVFFTAVAALVMPLVMPLPGLSHGLAAALWATMAFPIALSVGYWASRVFYSIVDEAGKK
jgi:hypothetical protein